ncbi:hypothetical protein B5G78_16105 [Listeria monocytogenes]|nr:hypothetical protein [Listeria monocytogenes]EAC2685205.1 hypothetical protein [Listeria monocytogenes]EAC9468300.1 hypothetical protein [Listeria monocytogenes]
MIHQKMSKKKNFFAMILTKRQLQDIGSCSKKSKKENILDSDIQLAKPSIQKNWRNQKWENTVN